MMTRTPLLLAARPAAAQNFSPSRQHRLGMTGPIAAAAAPDHQAATGLWIPPRNFGDQDFPVMPQGRQGILRDPAGQAANVSMGAEDQDSLTTREIMSARQTLTLPCE